MPPRTFPPVADHYAAHRCACRHIVYLDDQPGGSCRWCPCTDHKAPAARATTPSVAAQPAPPVPGSDE